MISKQNQLVDAQKLRYLANLAPVESGARARTNWQRASMLQAGALHRLDFPIPVKRLPAELADAPELDAVNPVVTERHESPRHEASADAVTEHSVALDLGPADADGAQAGGGSDGATPKAEPPAQRHASTLASARRVQDVEITIPTADVATGSTLSAANGVTPGATESPRTGSMLSGMSAAMSAQPSSVDATTGMQQQMPTSPHHMAGMMQSSPTGMHHAAASMMQSPAGGMYMAGMMPYGMAPNPYMPYGAQAMMMQNRGIALPGMAPGYGMMQPMMMGNMKMMGMQGQPGYNPMTGQMMGVPPTTMHDGSHTPPNGSAAPSTTAASSATASPVAGTHAAPTQSTQDAPPETTAAATPTSQAALPPRRSSIGAPPSVAARAAALEGTVASYAFRDRVRAYYGRHDPSNRKAMNETLQAYGNDPAPEAVATLSQQLQQQYGHPLPAFVHVRASRTIASAARAAPLATAAAPSTATETSTGMAVPAASPTSPNLASPVSVLTPVSTGSEGGFVATPASATATAAVAPLSSTSAVSGQGAPMPGSIET
ncbi:hypothetical protein EON62_02880, partial [archaeon]